MTVSAFLLPAPVAPALRNASEASDRHDPRRVDKLRPGAHAHRSTRAAAPRALGAAILVVCASACAPAAETARPAWGDASEPGSCCRICRLGKECGDACIARDRFCAAAPGCACDARRDGAAAP